MSPPAETLSTLNRALDVLEAFTPDQPVWGLSALSRELGIGKASLHRLLRNLEQRGYLRQDEDSKQYRLGYAVLRISQAAIVQTPTEVAQPFLRELARSVGEQTTLWVLDGQHAVCVAKVSGRQALRTHTDLGAREPALLIASGRCLLMDHAVDDLEGFDAAEARWLARFPAIRDNGYELSHGDRWGDVHAAAAPIRDHEGRLVAAIGVSAAATRFGEAELLAAASAVSEPAAAVTVALGGAGRRTSA